MRNTNKIPHLHIPSFFALLSLSSIHYLTTGVTGGSLTPFNSIFIGCGSTSDSIDTDGRTWISDNNNSKFSILDPTNASTIYTAGKPPSSGQAFPYKSARFSLSQFTYAIQATSGPKFIRLHFYSSSYDGGFSPSKAFFNVKASRYTLLSNFSTALHTLAFGFHNFFLEFILHVEDTDQRLNIEFTPTPGMADAYALINGIEVVSMPTNLYYTAEDDPSGFKWVGSNDLDRSLISKTALELMYRINVGGPFVPPADDTGMFRSWNRDDDYFIVVEESALLYNGTIQLRYTNSITRFAASDHVYRTARSMGLDREVNAKYNITWQFHVDSGFAYLVRLHFCEIQPPITEINDRVFRIYIATAIAQSRADVIEWSGGNGYPVYKDYGVLIEATGRENMKNLSIALHPLPDLTRYNDAILNGIEIFKMSASDNLAGPNPDISFVSPPTVATSDIKSTHSVNNAATIGAIGGGVIAGGVLSCFLVLSILFLFIFLRRSKGKNSGFSDKAPRLGPFFVTSAKSAKTDGSALPSDLCRGFSLAEIIEATNNFDSVFIVGVGGFCNVYKGLINDGAISVAIKRLNPESQQGANEFKTEIEMLSQLHYLHLVSLIGYCYEDGEMILVYDYMAKGTLRDHLYKTNNPPLPWIQRLEICIGAAKGLQYLHSGVKNTIIHRDVKTTNILLDEKWVAKVSDFGLSKIGPTSMSKRYISTVVKGSFGYLDPEYYRLQRLTEKSDVYSFGVVLFEVLSARPPVNKSSFNKPGSLAEWARQCYENGTLHDIVDPHLKGKIAADCLKSFFELGISCLLENGMDRPSMSDVVWRLEFALQLQETAILLGKRQTEIDSDMEMENPLKGSSSIDDSDLFSSSSALKIVSGLGGMTLTSTSGDQNFPSNNSDKKWMSGSVFSQIMNPEGR